MNTETYKLNDAGTHIVQQPEMKEPKHNDYVRHNLVIGGYADALKQYEEHIASLKRYDLGTVAPPEWKGKELIKNVDFKLQECENCDGCGWWEGGETLKTTCVCCKGSGIMVISILKEDANGRDESQDELIAKVADWAFRHGWKERSRMTGVNKKALDTQYYEVIRIMLSNKLYKKAFDNKYLGIIRNTIQRK